MAESDSKKHASEVAQSEQERAKRDSLFLLASMMRENGEPLGEARVRNLSATGLKADCTVMLMPDERVLLEIRGIGEISGRVAWAEGQQIGVAFDRRVDPQLARKPLREAPADDMPPYLRFLNRAGRFLR